MHFNALPERHDLRWVNFWTLLSFLCESTEATNASWNAGYSNTFPENFGSCSRGNFTPTICSVISLDETLTPFFAIKSSAIPEKAAIFNARANSAWNYAGSRDAQCNTGNDLKWTLGLMLHCAWRRLCTTNNRPSAKVPLLSFIKMANTRGWLSGLLKSSSCKIRCAKDRVASKVIMDASIRDKVEL